MLLEQIVTEAKRKKNAKVKSTNRRTTIKNILSLSRKKQKIPYMTPVRYGGWGFGGSDSDGDGGGAGDGGGGE